MQSFFCSNLDQLWVLDCRFVRDWDRVEFWNMIFRGVWAEVLDCRFVANGMFWISHVSDFGLQLLLRFGRRVGIWVGGFVVAFWINMRKCRFWIAFVFDSTRAPDLDFRFFQRYSQGGDFDSGQVAIA